MPINACVPPQVCKPCTLSALGDVALAVGSAFPPYLPQVLPLLDAAIHAALEPTYVAWAAPEDRHMLLTALLEACSGMLQGAKDNPPFMTALLPFCPTACHLVGKVTTPSCRAHAPKRGLGDRRGLRC
jgi:hypothetical protein